LMTTTMNATIDGLQRTTSPLKTKSTFSVLLVFN
jgi:hypothetical protein